MVLEWREREHEEDNANAENHPPTIAALKRLWSLKIFPYPGHESPSSITGVLSPNVGSGPTSFHVGAHTLTIDIEDIYFLTGLSRRGSYVSLTGSRGGGLKMSEYCNQYCVPEAERKKGKVAIWGVTD
jgi:hypothetical protein